MINLISKKILFWFKKNFGVLSEEECRKLKLEFYHNLYGESIEVKHCKSIWRDVKGKEYRCKSIINEKDKVIRWFTYVY